MKICEDLGYYLINPNNPTPQLYNAYRADSNSKINYNRIPSNQYNINRQPFFLNEKKKLANFIIFFLYSGSQWKLVSKEFNILISIRIKANLIM